MVIALASTSSSLLPASYQWRMNSMSCCDKSSEFWMSSGQEPRQSFQSVLHGTGGLTCHQYHRYACIARLSCNAWHKQIHTSSLATHNKGGMSHWGQGHRASGVEACVSPSPQASHIPETAQRVQTAQFKKHILNPIKDHK